MNIHKIGRPSDTAIRVSLALVLIAFAVGSRLVPHPDNMASVAAVALFAGALLPRRWALSLPLAAMIISDLVIGLHSTLLFTWGSFVLIALGGHYFLKQVKPLNVMLASFMASVLFYLVTNFGVWLVDAMYPMTASGLVQSYLNALPFFRNTLIGDLLFTSLLFGIYALGYRYAPQMARLVAGHAKTQ